MAPGLRWCFVPHSRVPRFRVRYLRARLHLKLHPGRGHADGIEPGVIDAVWNDDDLPRRRKLVDEPLGISTRRKDDARRPGCRPPDRSREVRHLRPFVPLRV